jgi:hypothetical protein
VKQGEPVRGHDVPGVGAQLGVELPGRPARVAHEETELLGGLSPLQELFQHGLVTAEVDFVHDRSSTRGRVLAAEQDQEPVDPDGAPEVELGLRLAHVEVGQGLREGDARGLVHDDAEGPLLLPVSQEEDHAPLEGARVDAGPGDQEDASRRREAVGTSARGQGHDGKHGPRLHTRRLSKAGVAVQPRLTSGGRQPRSRGFQRARREPPGGGSRSLQLSMGSSTTARPAVGRAWGSPVTRARSSSSPGL